MIVFINLISLIISIYLTITILPKAVKGQSSPSTSVLLLLVPSFLDKLSLLNLYIEVLILLLFIDFQSPRGEFGKNLANLLLKELVRIDIIHFFSILWLLLGVMMVFLMVLHFHIVSIAGLVHFPSGFHFAGLFFVDFAFASIMVGDLMKLAELVLIWQVLTFLILFIASCRELGRPHDVRTHLLDRRFF